MGFRDLERYPSLKAKYEKYIIWRDATPEERQAKFAAITDETRRSKPNRVRGYLSPFNTAGTTKIFIPVKLLDETQSGSSAGVAGTVRGLVNPYTVTSTEFGALTTPLLMEVKNYKCAKLTLTSVVPGTTRKNSRITGALYYKPDVDSVSSPFGQSTGGEDYDTVVTAIKGEAAYTTFINGNNGKNRASFTPEG